MIEIDRVSYTYPGAARPALADLSLTIAEGEFLLVCGPSGAGKSTFLRLLNGLVPHFHGGRIAGEVRAWGRSTRTHQPRDLADLVGFVFQDPEAQFVVDIVEDEIVFAMENLGLPQRIMRRRVEEVLDQLGIAHLRRRTVASLSGGERQRVAIAAALAAQPRALALDEPTSQLDPHAAEEVLTTLQKLNADLGLTVVLSEHRLERIVQYVDRILYLPGVDNDRPPTTDDRPPTTDHRQPTTDSRDKVTRRQEPGLSRAKDDRVRESEEAITLSPLHAITPSPYHPLIGPPREILAQIDLAPPLVGLGKWLGWSPLPLTIKEARPFARPTTDHRPPTTDLRDKVTGDRETITRSPLHPFTPSGESVVVRGVHFSYGEHEALYDLSCTARPGEVLALMGRNGSGKTTLLKLIVGLLKPQRGSITVHEHDVTRMQVEDIAALVGYVPQDPRALLFHDTLWEELEFTLDHRPPTTDHRASRVGQSKFQTPKPALSATNGSKIEATLDLLGLAHLARAYPRDLSGGEAQRAALAAILIGNPPVLLLDEPTRGLDYGAKATLGRLLRTLATEQRTIIISTHDVELVAAYADRVLLLGDGELIVEGPVREVLGDSLIFSSQIAKLFPGHGWLTMEDARRELEGRR